MPMIDLSLPRGALKDDAIDSLVDDLLAALLRWEGAPANEQSQSLAWAFVHVVDRITVASSPTGKPHYRVQVATPQGALDPERRAGMIAEATDLVLRAEGSPSTPENAFRVWVILAEVAEGSWGAEGRVWRFQDIVGYVLDDARAGELVAADRLEFRA